MATVTPTCITLLVCHEVIEDIRSRNKSVIGIFNQITAPSAPGMHPPVAVLLSLNGGRGKAPLTLSWRNDTTNELVMQLKGEVDFSQVEPMAVVDLVFNLPGLPFKEFGLHSFEVASGGVPLQVRRVMVRKAEGAT